MPGIPITPVVEPATSSQTYDTFWLSSLQIIANNPNQPVRVIATCQAMGTNSAGKLVLCETPVGRKTMTIPDFFAVATPTELETMAALLTAIKARVGM